MAVTSIWPIDRAILASTTEREFQRVMKEMGYEVITKTPKGSPRVHPIVRIVDGGKNFRLDKLGEYYELDSIAHENQRLLILLGRPEAFFELVTVFHDKVAGNIYQLLRVAVCLLYTHYLGFTEIVLKLGKQGNVAAGEAVNRLPVITNAQEFCIRLIDDCLYQIEAGYGNVLVLVNYHPFIRMNSVAFTNELSCLVNHIREINVAFRFEVFVIKQRIQNNYRRKAPFLEVAEDTKAPYYQYKEKAKKATGLYALYLYYCYELHIIVHKPASVKKVSAFLREDVTKLDRYIAQADFLAKTGIETVEALAGYKAEKEQQVEALTQQRTGLKNELKRHMRKEDSQSAEATRDRIAELSAELKTCRKEIALCTDIADRSEQVRKSLEQIEQQKIERKENAENELLVRRSSRAGREDDTQRR